MQSLHTKTQLIEYKKRLELQSEALSSSYVFTVHQRNELLQMYCNCIAICETRIKEITDQTIQQLQNSHL